MKARKKLIRWVKDHKTELIAAGICIGALILIILGIRNRKEILAIWEYLKEVIKHSAERAAETAADAMTEDPMIPVPDMTDALASHPASSPFTVSSHIRNLPEGWHPSAEKITEARRNNIILLDGQTWVRDYMKGCGTA